MVLENVAVGYDKKPVLRKLDLRLDTDDRIALLGLMVRANPPYQSYLPAGSNPYQEKL